MNFTRKGQDKLRGYCVEALDKAHTGIDKIDGEEVPFESADIPKGLKAMIKEKIDDKSILELAGPEKRYSVFLEDGKLKCLQLVTFHPQVTAARFVLTFQMNLQARNGSLIFCPHSTNCLLEIKKGFCY